MTNRSATDARLNTGHFASQLAEASDDRTGQPVRAWLLDPSTGRLFLCRTMSHTGPSTAKLFG